MTFLPRGKGVILQNLKVVVETGDLKDLGHRDIHLVRQCDKMAFKQTTVVVIEGVQMFDQQVAAVAVSGAWANQCPNVTDRVAQRLAALELAAGFANRVSCARRLLRGRGFGIAHGPEHIHSEGTLARFRRSAAG